MKLKHVTKKLWTILGASIPIVMLAFSMDPVDQGPIKSFERPRGHITALITAPQEL